MKNLLTMIAAFTLMTLDTLHAEDRIGAGVNYWQFTDDLESDVDESGLSFYAGYQRRGDHLGVELAAEIFPYRLDGDAWAPQIYLLAGSDIYAAVGVGIMSVDGEWVDDPFFALKAGINLEIRPDILLDISASYRFSGKEELEDEVTDIDTDTVFLGAALRYRL